MSVALVSLALLAFIWIGYPTLMWVLARLRPLPRTRWQGDLPGVTIVVATRESAEVIQRRVADLRRSAYPADRTEIVVVIDAHADPEIERSVGAIEGVRVLRGPRPGKAASVNAGVAAARGEVVVFADSGQQFAPGTIGALVDALADERVGAASGRLELHAGRGPRSLVELYWAI
ncbi:MAG TPA: glycosyltransferase, partial [Gemmatimonadaceae bacterium]